MRKILNIVFVLVSFILTTAVSGFPVQPITIYVPFPKGGSTDKVTRFVAEQVAKDLNQTIIVESNDTAMPSTEYINQLKIPSDGYHLIVGNLGTHASDVIVNKSSILYDPIDNFEPIILLGKSPMYLVVRPDFPANNFQEFMTYIIKNPDKKITIAHAGNGSTSYLASIYFTSIKKLNLNFVPYNGSAPALKDVANGYVDIMIDQTATALPYIQGGLVKAIFITSENPSHLTPNIQTSKQVGSPEFDIKAWNMIFAPKGTPQNIISALNTAFLNALDNKFVKAELERTDNITIDKNDNNNKDLKQFLKNEINYWQQINTSIDHKNDMSF